MLKAVNWEVHAGEHWLILGANGSGKTSLLSTLTAYLTPTHGTVEVLGQRYGHSDWRELRKSVGLVSSSVRQLMADHEPALITVASGKYAAIDFWGTPTPRERRRAREILRMVEAEHLADRRWQVLSQGERQRVLIGRALMAEPRILILDEPCSGLDPVARERFLGFVDRLGASANAPSLVLVTHHVEEIVGAVTHALLLRSGEIVARGPKKLALTSRNLSTTFAADCRLQLRKDRYSLAIHAAPLADA